MDTGTNIPDGTPAAAAPDVKPKRAPRPRPAAINLTPAAVARVQALLDKRGKPDGGKLVHSVTAPTATFSVPAGGYVVRATYKGTTADLVVPLTPGQSYEYTLNLYAGYAEPAAFHGKNKIAQDVTWQVVRAKPNKKGEHDLVTEQRGAEPKMMLREGKYLVIARYGDMWGKETIDISCPSCRRLAIRSRWR